MPVENAIFHNVDTTDLEQQRLVLHKVIEALPVGVVRDQMEGLSFMLDDWSDGFRRVYKVLISLRTNKQTIQMVEYVSAYNADEALIGALQTYQRNDVDETLDHYTKTLKHPAGLEYRALQASELSSKLGDAIQKVHNVKKIG